LPLAFLAGLGIGYLGMLGIVPGPPQGIAAIAEILLVLCGMLGAVIFAVATQPKARPVSEEDEVMPSSE
jgi:hypothetical protein